MGGWGGGANIPLWGTVFVFLKRPPGNGPGGPGEITTVSRQLQPYGNTHKNRYARRTCIYNRVQKCFGMFPVFFPLPPLAIGILRSRQQTTGTEYG
jgi:hypothetical protein